MILINELDKLIQKKTNRLGYIQNREKILIRTSLYNAQNRDLCKSRIREWGARESALKMKGLCHICFCSNVEVYNHHGQILCNGCMMEMDNEL